MNRLDESLSFKSFKKYITGKVNNKIDISKIKIDTDGIIKEITVKRKNETNKTNS